MFHLGNLLKQREKMNLTRIKTKSWVHDSMFEKLKNAGINIENYCMGLMVDLHDDFINLIEIAIDTLIKEKMLNEEFLRFILQRSDMANYLATTYVLRNFYIQMKVKILKIATLII